MTRPTTTGKAQDLITFTRSTTGTALAKISYGEELVTNGTEWTGASGTTPPTGWTSSGIRPNYAVVDGTLSVNPTSNIWTGYAITGLVIGKSYQITGEYKSGGAGGSVYLRIANSVGANAGDSYFAKDTSSTDWTTEQSTFTPTATTVYVSIGVSQNKFGYFDNVSVKEVSFDQPDGTLQLFNHPINKPRIEYDASGNCLGLLMEEARTNLLAYSGDIGAWVGSVGSTTNVTLTENALTAPDGTQTADKVQRTVLDTETDYRQTKSVVSGNDYTFSIFAKADVQARLELDFSNSKFSSADYVKFDVDTGTAYASGNGATYSVTDYGNGWYRFSLTATCTSSGDTGVIVRIINNEPHYAWGAQLEQGSFPTSYIPTSGSAVTRADDLASLAVSKFGYNQDQGSVVVESNFFGGTNTSALCYIGEDTSDRIVLYYSNQNLNFQVRSNGVSQASENLSGQRNKAAFRYKLNDIVLAGDGSITSTDTAANLLGGTQNNIYIGSYYHNAGAHLNGHIKSIKYYPVGLSNAQLQALTV